MDRTIEAEPGLPIATERDASQQKHEPESMRRERGLKKCKLELEREELQRKRREPEFEEEELEIERAGEQLEVRGDDERVIFVLRVVSKILGSSTADTQNLMLERKLSLPPAATISDLSPPVAGPVEDMVRKKVFAIEREYGSETTAVGTTKLF
jgi:hypothetical protein